MLDADSHASIYDGSRLGYAEVIRFRHNNPDDLYKRLRRLEGVPGDRLIVVEGIYSMLGDTAPPIAAADPMTSQPQSAPAPSVMAISPTSAAAAQLPMRLTGEAPAGDGSATPPSPDAGRIVLRASADAWVMVKDHSGTVLLNRTMKAGETWPVPPRTDLLLTAGNAGGTDILVDGILTPSLGASGAVRRDLPLDVDQIKDGKLAGATAPQLVSGRSRQ